MGYPNAVTRLGLVTAEGHRDEPYNVGFKNVRAIRDITRLVAKERGVPFEVLEAGLWRDLPVDWTSERMLREWMPVKVFNVVLLNWARILGDPSELERWAKRAYEVNFGGLTVLVDSVQWVLRFFSSPSWVFTNIVPGAKTAFNDNKVTPVVRSSWDRVLYRVVYQDRTGERTCEPEDDVESLIWFAPGVTAATAGFWGLEATVFHHLLELDLVWLLRRYLPTSMELVEGHEGHLYLEGRAVAQRSRLYLDTDGFYTLPDPGESENFREGFLVFEDIRVPKVDGTGGETWVLAKAGQRFCRVAGCSLTEYSWAPPLGFQLFLRGFHAVTGQRFIRDRVASHLGQRVEETDWEAQVEQAKARADALERERQKADADNLPTKELARLIVTGQLVERHVRCLIVVFDVEGFTPFIKELQLDGVGRLRPFFSACWKTIKRGSPWNPVWKPGDPVIWMANQPGDSMVLVYSLEFDGDSPLTEVEQQRFLLERALEDAQQFHCHIREVLDARGQPLRIRVGITWDPRLVLMQGGHSGRRIDVFADGVNRAARIQDAGKLSGLADPQGETTLLEGELAMVLGRPELFEVAGSPHLKGLGVVELVRWHHADPAQEAADRVAH